MAIELSWRVIHRTLLTMRKRHTQHHFREVGVLGVRLELWQLTCSDADVQMSLWRTESCS